jgi:hypothetical protein
MKFAINSIIVISIFLSACKKSDLPSDVKSVDPVIKIKEIFKSGVWKQIALRYSYYDGPAQISSIDLFANRNWTFTEANINQIDPYRPYETNINFSYKIYVKDKRNYIEYTDINGVVSIYEISLIDDSQFVLFTSDPAYMLAYQYYSKHVPAANVITYKIICYKR